MTRKTDEILLYIAKIGIEILYERLDNNNVYSLQEHLRDYIYKIAMSEYGIKKEVLNDRINGFTGTKIAFNVIIAKGIHYRSQTLSYDKQCRDSNISYFARLISSLNEVNK